MTQFKDFIKVKGDLVELGQEFKQLGFGITEFAAGPLGVLVQTLDNVVKNLVTIVEYMGLVKEDMTTFFKGGSSLTGDFFNMFEKKAGLATSYLATGGIMPIEGLIRNIVNHFDIDINNHGSDPDITAHRTATEIEKIKNRHASGKYSGSDY